MPSIGLGHALGRFHSGAGQLGGGSTLGACLIGKREASSARSSFRRCSSLRVQCVVSGSACGSLHVVLSGTLGSFSFVMASLGSVAMYGLAWRCRAIRVVGSPRSLRVGALTDRLRACARRGVQRASRGRRSARLRRGRLQGPCTRRRTRRACERLVSLVHLPQSGCERRVALTPTHCDGKQRRALPCLRCASWHIGVLECGRFRNGT